MKNIFNLKKKSINLIKIVPKHHVWKFLLQNGKK